MGKSVPPGEIFRRRIFEVRFFSQTFSPHTCISKVVQQHKRWSRYRCWRVYGHRLPDQLVKSFWITIFAMQLFVRQES